MVPNQNHSPRLFRKLYEMTKEILFNKELLTKYNSEFIESINISEDSFELNIVSMNNRLYYIGYPTGNYIKIFCKVLELWNSKNEFPIKFLEIAGLNVITCNLFRTKHNK